MKLLFFLSIVSFVWTYWESSLHLGEYYRMESGEFQAAMSPDAEPEESLAVALDKIVEKNRSK